MTGLGSLIRLALRRDRVVLPVWIVGIVVTGLGSASSIKDLYPAQADLARFAASIGDNPALIAVRGRAVGIDTLGGAISWQLGYFLMILAALMSILLVVRHTRADEEAGRTELLLAGPIRPVVPLVAALSAVGSANLLIGLLTALGLLALGLPATGSVVLAVSVTGVGLVFAAVAAVTAQLATTSRAAAGLAGAVLGMVYVVRAVGDVADNWISWLSPIGWGQRMEPYVTDRWWPGLLLFGATGLVTALALRLQLRRDLSAGLIAPRPGPPTGSRIIGRPLGFAVRLQRGTFAAWAVGLFLLGVAYGSLGQNVQDLLDTSPQAEDLFVQPGSTASVVDSFFGTTSMTLALIGTAFTIQAIGRLRTEESAGRAEPVLATALGRIRWASTHVAVALAGTALLLAAAGSGTGLAYALTGAGSGEVGRLLLAGVAQVPAAWVLGAVALALFGLVPRWSAAGWAPLAFCFVVGTLGPLLGLPDWVEDLSPYAAQPMLPAEAFAAGPLVGLTALAAGLIAAGMFGLRHRDIG